MRGRTWALGETFSMADCAAAPALFYANEVASWGDRRLEEAAPYFAMFPR